MSDPSTLLIATCLGCPQLPPRPAEPPEPCSPQHLNQEQEAVNEVRPCAIAPELLVASLESGNRLEKSATLQASADMAPRTSSPDASTTIHWSNTAVQSQSLLRIGSRGEAVRMLQTRLQQLGFYEGSIDGIYGDRTKSAVIQFQQARGLDPDGAVGLKTWAELQRVLPSPEASPSKPESSPSRERSFPEERSEESQPVPSPSPNVVTSSPSRQTQTPPVVSQVPSEYFWFLGWAIVYFGAGAVILRSAPQELAYFGFVKVEVRNKQFDSAINKVALNQQPPAKKSPGDILRYTIDTENAVSGASSQDPGHQPVKSTSFSAPISSNQKVASAPISPGQKIPPAPLPPNPKVPPAPVPSTQTEAMSISQGQKKISWANGGQVKPLHNVFAGLPNSNEEDDIDSPENNATSTSDRHPAGEESSTESSSIWNHDDEKLIAVLPAKQPESGRAYTYSLIDDADGIFVLRGNELRVIAHRLTDSKSRSSQITLRRTSAEGTSVTKSFTLEIEKSLMKQA
jgi:peptidoglycan hydrolase-like protein with peptidoglycan-binding domain